MGNKEMEKKRKKHRGQRGKWQTDRLLFGLRLVSFCERDYITLYTNTTTQAHIYILTFFTLMYV